MNETLTNYEKARLIGIRAEQIAHGAEILTDYGNLIDPIKIAEKEYYEGVIPVSVIRILPNNDKIKIKIIKK